MEPDPKFVNILKRLAAGQVEPEDWLDWWKGHADWAAEQLSRGDWLRLKPSQSMMPSGAASASQHQALRLLEDWGVEHERSERYEQQWTADFQKYLAEHKREQTQKKKRLRPQLDRLKDGFPKLARFLSRNFEQIEELAEPASDEQIEQLEQTLQAKLPESYRTFLTCTRTLVFGDSAQIGLPFTFKHPDDPNLPSAGRICCGEFWLEGDGDQVLFGDADAGREPPVLYYNHSEPSVRVLSKDFSSWIESLPRTLND